MPAWNLKPETCTPESTRMPTAIATLARWATPMPDMGSAVYRLTAGPQEHKHTYHLFCPWSPDQSQLLLLRYDRIDPEAEVCLLDAASGAIRGVAPTRRWETHSAAFQQWQGSRNHILYRSADDEGPTAVTVHHDGSDERVFQTGEVTANYCSPDGRWVYGVTPRERLFPNDDIAPRDDKGLWRSDLDTGDRELILSIEQAVSLVPDADTIAHCHLYAKMVVHHRRLPRVLFNLTNTFWDRDGTEPRIRHIISLDAGGENPAYIGRVLHHPNWHTVENRIVANVKDFNDTVRFGLYHGDGQGLLEYVPAATGSGHPSFSPDGRWLCTDGAGQGTRSTVVLCDPRTGSVNVAADYEAFSDGYASFKAIDERAPGETVSQALDRAAVAHGGVWQTQSHPAWSRDGTAVVFNADLGEGSQLYVVDVERTLGEAS